MAIVQKEVVKVLITDKKVNAKTGRSRYVGNFESEDGSWNAVINVQYTTLPRAEKEELQEFFDSPERSKKLVIFSGQFREGQLKTAGSSFETTSRTMFATHIEGYEDIEIDMIERKATALTEEQLAMYEERRNQVKVIEVSSVPEDLAQTNAVTAGQTEALMTEAAF